MTDNDSAKMATSKGVIQGYTAVDGEAQIIVAAQAHGSGSEQSVLLPMVKKTERLRAEQTIVTADAGYHTEANLQGLHDAAVPALVAGGLMRRRDERFAVRARYKSLLDPLYDKSAADKASEIKFQPADFALDPESNTCICPAGKKLHSSGSARSTHGRRHHKFNSAKRDCLPCTMHERRLRHPERTAIRQVAFFDKDQHSPLRYTERMKRTIDSPRGRRLYGRCIAIIEPVFANLRHNKHLDHFTLRTQPKVNTQWNLYCVVHNIEKLAHHGYASWASRTGDPSTALDHTRGCSRK